MLGLIVVTHGKLAEVVVQAATTIVGSVEGLEAVSIDWDDDVDAASAAIDEAIHRVDRGDGVLVLTDMFGGTPTNLAMSLHEAGSIEVVTGVNLPMLIKFTGLREECDLQETARRIAQQGREAIQVASHVLAASDTADDESASE